MQRRVSVRKGRRIVDCFLYVLESAQYVCYACEQTVSRSE